MIIPLDNAFDEHWIYVHRHQKTGFNIIVRAQLDSNFTENQVIQAVAALCRKHPYLLGKVVEDPSEREGYRFYLEISNEKALSQKIEEVSSVEIETLMKQLSKRREYFFDIEKGELAHLQLWQNKEQCLLEFSCVHLLGDVTAVLLIVKDLLHYLDQSRNGVPSIEKPVQRLMFDEKRYGWEVEQQPILPLPLPENAPDNPDKWPPPEFLYGKYSFPLSQFNVIRQWLKDHQIEATVNDLFYYIASNLYSEVDEDDLNFSVVLSFRHLLKGGIEQNNVNTSVIFSLINMNDIDAGNVRAWLNQLNATRKAALSQHGIMGLIHFLRCLNAALYEADEKTGRALINTYLPIDLFAFNNFGKLDHIFDHTKNFNVTEIDIQDGVPCQEVRMFSFKGRLHMNPMLSPKGPYTPEKFWQKFTSELKAILRG